MANRIVEEMIRKSKVASIANRGAYHMTADTNVYKQDGTPLEERVIVKPNIPEPDVVVNPTVVPIIEVISEVNSGAVIAVTAGEIAEELNLNKGVIIQGVNAGIPQNRKQEV